jgi:tRNA threonylcarbamoyl adenosine modification protein (Sua5/YciO/YrdC/YwlC family)
MFTRRKGEIIPFDPARPDDAAVRQAAATLDASGIIAFPTDTVYGLGCRADAAAAVRRIYAVKGRAARKPLVLLVPDAAMLPALATDIPAYARALIERFWPGPLTLVLKASPQVLRWKLDRDGTVGIRAAPSPLVARVVAATGVPLASTSANRSGERESLSALAVARGLARPVDLILDGGPLAPSLPSTVVDATGPVPVILRKGALSRDALQQTAGVPVKLAALEVMVVCTGNTCRSPMAEGYLRQILPKEWRNKVAVRSSGTGALPGMPATRTAQEAARRAGFNIGRHAATLLTDSLIRQADLIVAMEERHRQAIRDLVPDARPVLLSPDGVPDPIGGELPDYQRTLEIIKAEMPDVVTLIRELLA